MGNLLEYHLREFGQIDTPVAPDVASIGLAVGVRIAFAVQPLTQVSILLIQEVGLTDSNPVELWLGTEEGSHLLVILSVVVHALDQWSWVTPSANAYCCREQAYIVEGVNGHHPWTDHR